MKQNNFLSYSNLKIFDQIKKVYHTGLHEAIPEIKIGRNSAGEII